MDKLIYSVYFILPVLLLWGAKVEKIGEWNDEALSLRQSKAVQGFLALCIMFHHIGQKTCASWLNPPSRIQKGLGFFVPLGFLLVSVFLFFNGYGIYKSFHAKDNYLKGFVKKRILPVVLALYSTTIIFFIARILVGEKMDGQKVFWYLTSIKLCNPNTWYVIVLPFFYLFFYVSFRFIKKDGLAVAAVCGLVLLYMLEATRVDHNDFWIRGQWWYNCVHLFPMGVVFAKYEKNIMKFFKKFYVVLMPLSVLGLYPLYKFSTFITGTVSYYGENWNAPDKIMRRRICLGSEMLVTLDFVLVVILLCMKLRIGNKFLKFMGTITLEFYLIHGLFVEMFDHTFDGGVRSPFPIRNLMLYAVMVSVLGIPSAMLLKKFHTFVLGKSKNSTIKSKDMVKSA